MELLYQNRDWLYQKFVVEYMSDADISKICHVNNQTVQRYRTKFQILKCQRIRKCKFCGTTKNLRNNELVCKSCLWENIRSAKWYSLSKEERTKISRIRHAKKKEKLINASVDIQIRDWAKRACTRTGLNADFIERLANEAIITFPYMNFKPGRRYDKIDERPSIDKINPDLGYIESNVRVVPMWVNSGKLKMDINLYHERMRHYLSTLAV